MAKKAIPRRVPKPPPKKVKAPTPKPVERRASGVSDPVEGRMADNNTEKAEKYARHMMSLNARRSPNERCWVCIGSLVNRQRAEEWARYYQPQIDAPITLVIEGTLERINIDHGTKSDLFPARPINYPWASEIKDIIDKGRVRWTNDGTNRNGATIGDSTVEPAIAEPAAALPQAAVQPVEPPARRPPPAKPPAPPSVPPRAATAVPAKPVARRVAEPTPVPAKPASIVPRRVIPTPPNRKRR